MSGSRSRYKQIAEQLTDEAESHATVSTYISEYDVARALGDKTYDADETPLDILKDWVGERRRLGFEPTADDVLDWIEQVA